MRYWPRKKVEFINNPTREIIGEDFGLLENVKNKVSKTRKSLINTKRPCRFDRIKQTKYKQYIKENSIPTLIKRANATGKISNRFCRRELLMYWKNEKFYERQFIIL